MSDLISRQAAIDEIREWKTRMTVEGLVAHILALPSAQPVTHEERTKTHACDLISRQDAIDVLDGGAELLRRVLDDTDIVGAERRKYKWGLGLFESCIYDMKELPSEEPERKKGKWIDKSGDIEGAWNYCSVCMEQAIDLYDFCPNCGADMRGEEE